MEWGIVGTQSPLKYASPKNIWGFKYQGWGAKASALKTSLEIASTSVRGCGAPRVGRSWRPRLGKAGDLGDVWGLSKKATRMHHRHSFELNSLSRGGRRQLEEGETQGRLWRAGAPGAPRNPAAHSQYKALQQDGRRSAPCCLKPERPNEDGQGQLGVGVRGTWHNTA